jgi:hypothetical protein
MNDENIKRSGWSHNRKGVPDIDRINYSEEIQIRH